MDNEAMPKKERRMMKREEKRRKEEGVSKGSAFKQWGVTAFVVLGVAGGVSWWGFLGPRPSAEGFDPAKVCTSDPRTRMHIHPQFSIVIEGKPMTIPSQIGITPSCMRPIHTHDDTGKIHIESPVVRDFTLGEFFRVWDKPFDHEHVLDKVVDSEHRIVLIVDGKESQEYQNLVLKDGQQIEIRYERIP